MENSPSNGAAGHKVWLHDNPGGGITVDKTELRKQIVAELLQYKAELSQGLNQLATGKPATELSADRILELIEAHTQAARINELAMFKPVAESWVEKHHSYLGVNYLNKRIATITPTKEDNRG